ncbi:MAG: phage portal protein [Gammaproteobacteria bacterium]|nr:phage portal protein [Gammaproteobacteria bacterium]
MKTVFVPHSRAAAPARAYEATSTRPRVEDWTRELYGPNAALDDSDYARARAQDAIRNNPWINNALDLIVSHEIGCGIQPRPKIKDAGLRKELVDLWNFSVPELDADGTSDFYAWQSLLSRAENESGEVFVRRRPRLPNDGLVVPIQFQALEADLLPLRHNAMNDKNSIRQGIERNPYGKRVAYWFYTEHPADRSVTGNAFDLKPVPADQIAHHYTPLRPGQLRGEPKGISALLRARVMDGFEAAELDRRKARAKFVGGIYRETEEENPVTDGSVTVEAQIADREKQRAYVEIENAYLLSLAPNERMVLENGDTGGQNLLDFFRTQLRGMAAAWGVPYELMTGDYGGTNDRIMRVILNAFYRRLEIRQDRLVSQVLQPIWCWWLDAAVDFGVIRLSGYRVTDEARRAWQQCEWRAFDWSYVNPLQEVQTKVLKIKNGLSSQSAEIAATGWDAEDVDQDNANDQRRHQRLGLTYGDRSIAKSVEKP